MRFDYRAAYLRSRNVADGRVRGVHFLMKKNAITELTGHGSFTDPHTIRVDLAGGGTEIVTFDHAIIATGATARLLPGTALVDELARTNTQWASNTQYQVLHWTRVRPGDLSAEELTWHGITSDIDPTTGTVAYSRGGKSLSPETTVGHRPIPDPTPVSPGTYPGARPALLPAAPGQKLTGITAATSQGVRTDRAKRIINARCRREMLFQRAPTADVHWAEAIIAAHPLWGPDEEWKLLIDQTTTEAAPPVPPQLRSAEKGAPITTTLPHDPGPTTPTAERAAGLGAFAAELQDLYRP